MNDLLKKLLDDDLYNVGGSHYSYIAFLAYDKVLWSYYNTDIEEKYEANED